MQIKLLITFLITYIIPNNLTIYRFILNLHNCVNNTIIIDHFYVLLKRELETLTIRFPFLT
jgi:hypothetical protein